MSANRRGGLANPQARLGRNELTNLSQRPSGQSALFTGIRQLSPNKRRRGAEEAAANQHQRQEDMEDVEEEEEEVVEHANQQTSASSSISNQPSPQADSQEDFEAPPILFGYITAKFKKGKKNVVAVESNERKECFYFYSKEKDTHLKKGASVNFSLSDESITYQKKGRIICEINTETAESVKERSQQPQGRMHGRYYTIRHRNGKLQHFMAVAGTSTSLPVNPTTTSNLLRDNFYLFDTYDAGEGKFGVANVSYSAYNVELESSRMPAALVDLAKAQAQLENQILITVGEVQTTDVTLQHLYHVKDMGENWANLSTDLICQILRENKEAEIKGAIGKFQMVVDTQPHVFMEFTGPGDVTRNGEVLLGNDDQEKEIIQQVRQAALEQLKESEKSFLEKIWLQVDEARATLEALRVAELRENGVNFLLNPNVMGGGGSLELSPIVPWLTP